MKDPKIPRIVEQLRQLSEREGLGLEVREELTVIATELEAAIERVDSDENRRRVFSTAFRVIERICFWLLLHGFDDDPR